MIYNDGAVKLKRAPKVRILPERVLVLQDDCKKSFCSVLIRTSLLRRYQHSP